VRRTHRVSLRLAAALLAALALTVPARADTLTRYWSLARAMHAIDGVRIRVGTRLVRVDADTTLCSGEGPKISRHGVRMWSRFVCTFTTFTKSGLDHDLDFKVYVTGRTRFTIRHAHWIPGVR
jgi:hypothetical protein